MSASDTAEKEVMEYFRPGCYATIVNNDRAILVKKMRWPFEGMYDLPGGGIEHGEDYKDSLVRELDEEIGFKSEPADMELAGVFKYVVKYEKGERFISQHIIAIVYNIQVNEETFSSIANSLTIGSEIGGDAGERIILKAEDIGSASLTPICKQALEKILLAKVDFGELR